MPQDQSIHEIHFLLWASKRCASMSARFIYRLKLSAVALKMSRALEGGATYWAVAFSDAMLSHDVQDTHADGISITSSPRQHSQA